MKIPTVTELLENGVHFGHQAGRWHPKMKPFIFGVRSGIHIIDLEKTQAELQRAADYVKGIVSRGGVVLFVGTKKQVAPIVAKAAQSCGMPFVTERWLGGTLTNFTEIRRVLRRLKDLKAQKETGGLKKYTKLEQLQFDREIMELEKKVGGIQDLEKRPEAVIVVDTRNEKTAVMEARVTKTPIVAMIDTNVNPRFVQYGIPANDDAVKSVSLITKVLAEAVNEGKKEVAKVVAPAAAPAPKVTAPAK